MTTQEFLENELKKIQYQRSLEDQKLLTTLGHSQFIWKKLTSKKFRKWALDPLAAEHIQGAIKKAVKASRPLSFRYGFGGYKLWRLPSSPEVDWAEFFMLAYYCQYLAPIAKAYPPGVKLTFVSDDCMVERLNNIPTTDIQRYGTSFQLLLNFIAAYLPANLKLEVLRVADDYPTPKAMERELMANAEAMKLKYAAMDATAKAPMLASSELNICWDGAQDLTGLTDTQKRQKIEYSALLHDAYRGLSRRNELIRGETSIPLFAVPTKCAIPIGTTKSSVTKFWVGYGVLDGSGEDLKARVLSPQQFEGLSPEYVERTKVNIVPLKNFKEIAVCRQTSLVDSPKSV